jgi:HEAT repeat protein
MIDDEDYEVKIAAIKGLSNADPAVVSPYLMEALRQKTSLKVRHHLIEALGDLKATQATQTLIEMLEEKSTVLVLSAVEALGKIQDVRAIEPLKRLYESDDKDVTVTAKEAVNNIKNSLLTSNSR